MAICNVCGKSAMFTDSVGAMVFCKACARKLMVSKWKEKAYSTNAEVAEQKEKVLDCAFSNHLNPQIIRMLGEYFDAMIEDGLIRIIDGHEGQTLKVYKDRLMLITGSGFPSEDLVSEYSRMKRKAGFSKLGANAAGVAVRGLLTGGVAKAGLSLAATAGAEMLSDGLAAKSELQNISKGKKTLYYGDCEEVLVIAPADTELALLKVIVANRTSDNNSETFFYSNYSDTADKVIAVSEYIAGRIREEKERLTRPAAITGGGAAVDELIRYKELLDQGIITPEEFTQIKRKLMGI